MANGNPVGAITDTPKTGHLYQSLEQKGTISTSRLPVTGQLASIAFPQTVSDAVGAGEAFLEA
jgi:hypothetical protein